MEPCQVEALVEERRPRSGVRTPAARADRAHPDGTGAREETNCEVSANRAAAGPPSFIWLPRMLGWARHWQWPRGTRMMRWNAGTCYSVWAGSTAGQRAAICPGLSVRPGRAAVANPRPPGNTTKRCTDGAMKSSGCSGA